MTRAWRWRKALRKYTRQTGRAPLPGSRKGTGGSIYAETYLPKPSPPHPTPGGRWKSQADVVLCCASPRQVRERLQLEARLVKSCRRGALLQPLDMAGVTEQVVLQRVAAVTVFVIELQTAVLAVVALHMVVSVHGHDADGLI